MDSALTRIVPKVAADGGAEVLLARGIVPDATIGDMDSISPGARAKLPVTTVHEITEQDSTDFDKALRHIAAPLVLGFGFLGARMDHALAALTVLTRHPDRRCILVGDDDVVALLPPSIRLALEPGTRVSLYPMGPVTGRSTGLRWPIDGIDFAPGGQVGTSNMATGPVSVQVDAPRMLVLLPAACLSQLEAGFAQAHDAWPVPAG